MDRIILNWMQKHFNVSCVLFNVQGITNKYNNYTVDACGLMFPCEICVFLTLNTRQITLCNKILRHDLETDAFNYD